MLNICLKYIQNLKNSKQQETNYEQSDREISSHKELRSGGWQDGKLWKLEINANGGNKLRGLIKFVIN